MAVKKAAKKSAFAATVSDAVKAPSVVKAKKAAAPQQSAKPPMSPESYVLIDHPADGEIISGLHYAIRVGASDNGSVELSFNNGEWQPCRASAGYWWFDWGYFTPGAHKIIARLRSNDGATLKKSSAVKCEVK